MDAAPFQMNTPSEKDLNNNDDTNLLSPEEFDMTLNNKAFNIIISITSTKQYLYIQAKEEGNFAYLYEIKMSYLDLIKFDKIFKTCEDLEDAYNSMLVIMKNEKNLIKEIKDDKFIMSIFILNLDMSFREKNLELIKKSQNKDVIIQNLCQCVSELKLENTNLKNELTEVKQKLSILEEKINNLVEKEMAHAQEPKFDKVESAIFKSNEEYDFIIERLKKVNLNHDGNNNIIRVANNIKLKLIYSATKDGCKAKDFHLKCDNYNNILILIKTKKGLKFGGFTTETWAGEGDKLDKEAFCFSLNKKKIYNYKKGKSSIYVSPDYGPTFGNCVFEIKDEFITNGGMCSQDYFYDNQETECDINNEEEQFDIEELEAFNITFIF